MKLRHLFGLFTTPSTSLERPSWRTIRTAKDRKRVEPLIVNGASEAHRAQMKELAEFCQADEIEYTDLGNGENYRLRRGAVVLVLKVRGNKFDGAFLHVDGEDA